jgi:hypothetical protein
MTHEESSLAHARPGPDPCRFPQMRSEFWNFWFLPPPPAPPLQISDSPRRPLGCRLSSAATATDPVSRHASHALLTRRRRRCLSDPWRHDDLAIRFSDWQMLVSAAWSWRGLEPAKVWSGGKGCGRPRMMRARQVLDGLRRHSFTRSAGACSCSPISSANLWRVSTAKRGASLLVGVSLSWPCEIITNLRNDICLCLGPRVDGMVVCNAALRQCCYDCDTVYMITLRLYLLPTSQTLNFL